MGRRIGGAGGGSDPGSGKGARAVVAAAAAVTLLTGTGAIGGGAAVSSSAASGAQSALMRSLGPKKVDARNAMRRGDARGAWRRMGMRASKEQAKRYVECVSHSVGQVREFLARNPCRRLDWMLMPVPDGEDNVAVVAVSSVEFRSRATAQRFKTLYDRFGTGYVVPPAGAALGHAAGVRLTGQHYRSRLNKSVVVTAEAEPVRGRFDDAVLDAFAEVAVLYRRR